MIGLAGESRVRQVPQVPLSQELGDLVARRTQGLEDRPVGRHVDDDSPERASRTRNGGRSALRVAAASTKALEMHGEDDQCPVMSRTASIIGRGPQQ